MASSDFAPGHSFTKHLLCARPRQDRNSLSFYHSTAALNPDRNWASSHAHLTRLLQGLQLAPFPPPTPLTRDNHFSLLLIFTTGPPLPGSQGGVGGWQEEDRTEHRHRQGSPGDSSSRRQLTACQGKS